MNQPSSGALPAAFLERLVAAMDPHGAPLGGERLEAKLACGRWLALQRLRQGLPLDRAAQRAQLDVEALELLEAGLADQRLLPLLSRRLLSNALSGGSSPYALVYQAVDVATEQWASLSASLLDHVWAELVGAPPPAQAALPDEVAATSSGSATAAAALSDTEFLVVCAIEAAPAPPNLVAITDAVAAAQRRVSDWHISLELKGLAGRQLIEQLPPESRNETLPRFAITPAGRQVLAAEIARRARAQVVEDPNHLPDEPEALVPVRPTH